MKGCSLGRMKQKLQAKRVDLCFCVQIWKKSCFWISNYHLLTVDPGGQCSGAGRGVLVAVFLNM